MTTEPLLETMPHALDYTTKGWAVFPIRPRSKRPRTRHGSSDATSHQRTIEKWWTRWPHDGIGGILPLAWCVIDIDPRNSAALTPDDLPATLTARTGGGWHCYFRRPGLDLARSSDDPRLTGVDLILGGRAITLPPSLHPNGRRYEWINDKPPAALPTWIGLAYQRPARPVQHGPGTCEPGPLLDKFKAKLDDVRTAPDGTRNRALRNVAFFAGGLVTAGALTEADAESLLHAATTLPQSEAAATIRGGLRDGAARPLNVKGTT